jgi:diamine N-acetyltransferase
MTLKLQEVTADNWIDCIGLQLREDQKDNLAANVATIAESKFDSNKILRAICLEDKVIGMLAYCPEDDPCDPRLFWLYRFMIDQEYQGLGHGRQSLLLVVEEIKRLGAARVHTMCKPGNAQALAVYLGSGFEQLGYLDDGDCLLELTLSA